jgi:hypothetical protein
MGLEDYDGKKSSVGQERKNDPSIPIQIIGISVNPVEKKQKIWIKASRPSRGQENKRRPSERYH